MFVPNSKILGQLVPEESLTKIHIHYIGVRGSEKEKEGKINLSTLVLFTIINLVVLIVYTQFEECCTHTC